MKRARSPHVVIFAPESDPQARAVQSHVQALGEACPIIDLGALAHGEPWSTLVTRAGVRATFAGVRIDAIKAAYVRGVPGAWPPVGTDRQGRQVVLEKWLAPLMLAREREAVVTGLLHELHARGVALLNPPSSSNKPLQLSRAAALGVPVPRTLITNAPADAAAFIRDVGRAIAKPVNGGALTVALEERALRRPETREQLERIRAAPVILQERIDGDDVRVMLLGNRVLSSLAVQLPEGAVLDFRGSEAYQAGRATYEHVALPDDVRRAAARWARACGLVFAGVDLKRTARGAFIFLECNSSPIYLDGELKSGDPISKSLAAWLVRRCRH